MIDIIMPKLKDDTNKIIKITSSSPISHKKAVEKIAYYFKREFSYDFVQYEHNTKETDNTLIAYLWMEPYFAYDSKVPTIGATVFRWINFIDHPPCWVMCWVWFHPFYRGRGILKESWGLFNKEFGSFVVDPPYSKAMEYFLKNKL
jgi:hypothetical protein